MKIPKVLTDLLGQDTALSSFSLFAVDRISRHVEASRLDFFPEYTDHGIKHIEETLQTSVDLATDIAISLLSATDAAILTVAVALHDFGMHLTRDGFESLIAPGSRWVPLHPFDNKPWSELWESFYAEARRFDGRKLRSIFGEKYTPPRPLPKSGEAWNDFDRLLVGEFLRRHHHRLAHEIAVYGFPGIDGHSVQICLSSNQNELFWADMAGLIARSHGMSLRPCVDYLQSKYLNRVDPKRAHAAFIMTLLRLSDYFQIQPSRAPEERTDIGTFLSSLSKGEWKVHQCVVDINNTSDDPDAIVINARPANVETYLKVKKWLTGIQDELDSSWAVLGEVYGRQHKDDLDQLNIKLRRVRSNLDRIDEFSKTVTYVPQRIVFDTASSDLLNLLVGPLYSNNSAVGLRELMQNAIDSVREMEDLIERRTDVSETSRYIQDADVVLELECSDQNTLISVCITDRGVGMTAEIVRDYFLKAGASFRRSDAWRRDHEDAAGHSRVLRTGRFGVGVLAAFLLGDEIEVTTRHVSMPEDEALRFKARVDSEAIPLERTRAPIGTRIRIEVPVHKRRDISMLVPHDGIDHISFGSSYGHYFLRSPSLKRTFSHLKRQVEVEKYLPQPHGANEPPWRSFAADGFGKVFWTYDYQYPHLACNGIVIMSSGNRDYLNGTPYRRPNLSVFDRDGLLPVNLQRTNIQQGPMPFEDEMLKSVVEDIISYAIVSAPVSCQGRWLQGRHPAFYAPYMLKELAFWAITKNGFFLNDPQILKALSPNRILIAFGGAAGFSNWGDVLLKSLANDEVILSYAAEGNLNFKGGLRDAVEGLLRYGFFKGFKFSGSITWVSKDYIKKVESLNPGKELRKILSKFKQVPENPEWLCLNTGALRSSPKLKDALSKLSANDNAPGLLCDMVVHEIGDVPSQTTVAEHWHRVVGSYVVPFDLKGRKRLRLKIESEIPSTLEMNIAELLAQRKERLSREELVQENDYE